VVKLKSKPVDAVVVQIRMPTTGCNEEDIRCICDKIEHFLDREVREHTDYGELNAVAGEGKQ